MSDAHFSATASIEKTGHSPGQTRLGTFGAIATLGVCLAAGLFGLQQAQAATPFAVGAYLGNPNGSDPNAEARFAATFTSFRSALGTVPHLITTYVDYNQPMSSWASNASWQAWSNAQSQDAKTLIPVIGFPMASLAAGSGTPDSQFRALASGQYDAVIAGVVVAWAQQGYTRLFVRPGWEMNIQGPTYAGDDAQSQADWVAAFQHIHLVLKKAAAAAGIRATVIWNPNATNYSNANAMTALYPGDRYVDIIGIDMYSDIYPYSDGGSSPTYYDWTTGQEDTTTAQFIADPTNRAHFWSYPAATKWSLDSSGGHCQSLPMLLQFALQHKMKVAIPEAGAGNSNAGTDVSDDPTYPQWLAQQLHSLKQQGGRVVFVNIWNSNGGGNYEFSFPSDGKPQEAAAWKTYFGVTPLSK